MKTYSIYISRSFSGYVEIQANNEKEAEDIVWEQITSGEIEPLEFDSDTMTDYPQEITE